MPNSSISKRVCSVEGCLGLPRARGWCSKHYSRWITYRDPTTIMNTDRSKSTRERIEEGSEPITETGCWVWVASVYGKGYGQLWFNGKHLSAHRVAYEAFIGPIPEGLHVLHRCDMPACVNPAHLFLGTNKANSDDKVEKGRQARGEGHGLTALTNREVLEIKTQLTNGYYRGMVKDLAAEYKVDPKVVSRIKTGARWKWLSTEEDR